MTELPKLLQEIATCKLCAAHFSHAPRPVLAAASSAKILIIGQAPGSKVHASGIPWNDQSGKRLRKWLDMSDADFYNPDKVAIVPMGFCYPGKGKSGDLPPRPECAQTWHKPLLTLLPNIKLTLLIGAYAQSYYLKEKGKKNLTKTVRNFSAYAPKAVPLPHPSPRNEFWLRKNPWFEIEVLPFLKDSVRGLT